MRAKAPPQLVKTCSLCKEEKPASAFYKKAGRLNQSCKPCTAEYSRSQREKHSESRRAYDTARGSGWDRTGREQYQASSEESFSAHLRRNYGMTLARYDQMLVAQQWVCAICKKPCNRSSTERLCVDHCHQTGRVRGLLCFKCNTGLGRFDDSVDLLERATEYIRRSEAAAHGLPSIFLSGPMTGLPRCNYPAFNAAARHFRSVGHRVANPADNHSPTASWEDYMRMSIRQLVGCELIVLLPGWLQSKGAQLEHHIAEQLGMQRMYLA